MAVGYPILSVEQLPDGTWSAEADGISANGGTEAEALENLLRVYKKLYKRDMKGLIKNV